MDTEWSIAAGVDDPVLMVPWSDDTGKLHFVDLREDSAAVDQIEEAITWSEIRAALLVLNARSSSVWTSKCDAWVLSDAEKELDFGPVLHGFGTYFDVFARKMHRFSSVQKQTSEMQEIASCARKLGSPDARLDLILRPAWWQEQDGFAMTVYVFGYGHDQEAARAHWSHAMANVTRLIAERAS